LNLLVNAAHAIVDAKRGRGKIAIKTRAKEDTVVVTIRDNGCGIPEDIRAKIFEPFFTTKVGRGTGQGLAISRAIIVDKHQGTLTLDSEVGRGTTFTIRFPRSASVEAAA
jgi:two-component system, NtrC family, sensor kinase